MNKIYGNPIRVYVLLGAIALLGIYAGLNLPVSLFPNSSKPKLWVGISYGNATAEEFLNAYGDSLENQIKGISTDGIEVEKIEASYGPQRVNYEIEYRWGVDPNEARIETERVVNSFAARLPRESRDSVGIWLNNENTGFFAMAFYSETRNLNELYEILEPALGPRIAQVADAQDPVLWNPSREEIRIDLNPEVMAALQLLPRNIETAVTGALGGQIGGSLTVGPDNFQIEMPRQTQELEDLGLIPVSTPSGRLVHLNDVAHIDKGPKTKDSRSFKTSGSPSLILFSVPKPGGNVKKMSEDLILAANETLKEMPADVRSRELVDPSEFIRSAVNNVFFEVCMAALLAVLVLFLFIGSFRNVVTAAIEIPMSMVLAFILMRISGMNLNLISLGGLALSAGMNVDASVVVMENIFRHFEMDPGPHSYEKRLRIITQAVREVVFPILAATISSLVVFLPLTFTSDLSYAILGDLAKAVVFSHGFSVFVAILLVPTIRLQLMSRKSGEKPVRSIIEKPLKSLEEGYGRLLSWFVDRGKVAGTAYVALSLVLAALMFFVLPRLPKEIIGTPDTDWMILGVNTDGNTLLRQMEVTSEEVERELLDEFGDEIRYTFNQVRRPNSATIMARLKNKENMKELWKKMEARFTNTPLIKYWVAPWNPSELPIPDPPDMRITIRGGETEDKAEVTRAIQDVLEAKKAFPRIDSEPNVSRRKGIFVEPHLEQWESLVRSGVNLMPSDLADVLRVATDGREIGDFPSNNELTGIVMRYPSQSIETVEDVGAFPLGVGSKIIPLKALATIGLKEAEPTIYRENQRPVFIVTARKDRGDESESGEKLEQAKTVIAEWKESEIGKSWIAKGVSVNFENAKLEIEQAIDQLGTAVGLSILLIFITLLVQFGSVMEPLLVLVSVPLGFIGVLLSLFVFGSTLSLNAVLGVILLNGIAVANSILLVDFTKKLVGQGWKPEAAAVEAGRKRLRPILITSFTTILGMMPIALGTGEGGHILQPLGIAVSGGLWVSTFLTLFIVPRLHVSYLRWSQKRANQSNAHPANQPFTEQLT